MMNWRELNATRRGWWSPALFKTRRGVEPSKQVRIWCANRPALAHFGVSYWCSILVGVSCLLLPEQLLAAGDMAYARIWKTAV